MKQQQYRQGDVLLIPVSNFENGYTRSKTKTVALGEATGHHHTFEGDVDVLIEDSTSAFAVNAQGMLVDVISNEAVLRHREHAPIVVPMGKYRRVIQREFALDHIRTVAD